MVELRDIRFSMNAGERLVVRGFIERKDIMNAKDGKIVIHQIPESIAKRISDYCDFEINNFNEWIFVTSGDYAAIELIYADKNEPKEEKVEVIVEPEPVKEEVVPEVAEPVIEEPAKVEEPVAEVVEEVVISEERHEEVVEKVSNTVVEEPISLMDTVKDIDLSNAPEAHFEEAVEEKVEDVAPVKEEEPVIKSVTYQQNKPVHVNKKKHH